MTPESKPRLPPLKAVRAHCLWCCDGERGEVERCPARHCPLWLLRFGHRPTAVEVEQNADVTLHPSEQPITAGELHAGRGSALKAIRRRCIDRSGGSLAEVRSCKCDTCPLHPFRMGTNPNIRLSPERKAELLARLQHIEGLALSETSHRNAVLSPSSARRLSEPVPCVGSPGMSIPVRDFLEGDNCASKPFGDAALALNDVGLVVFPCGGDDGKRPLVKRWHSPKARETVAAWADRFADTNIGVACGASGIVIVDVDRPELIAAMLERFGDTPLTILTPSEGAHLWYRNVDGVKSTNLRSEGLDVDIKADGGMVLVPPSYNRQSGVPYEFELGCSWDDLARLPTYRREALAAEIDPRSSSVGEVESGAICKGGRNNALFCYLMRVAHTADEYSALLAAARSFNADHLSPPLLNSEVEKTTRSVWRYQSEGRNWVGSQGHVDWSVTRVLECAPHKHAGDAVILMTVLRAKHAKRKKRFAVGPRAMAKAQILPGWTEHRYRTALKAAIKLELIEPVYTGGRRKGDASLYRLPSYV